MKVAVALSEGKAININGGNYILCHCDFCCFGCEKGNNGGKRRKYEVADNYTDRK